jgi:ferredoxin
MTAGLAYVFILLSLLATGFGFRVSSSISRSTHLYGLGDILKKALANDPNLPPAQNPGLSRDPDPILVEFLPSKKVVKGFPGQAVSVVAQAAGVDIKYSCKKGECATCNINLNGSLVKACQSKLPSFVAKGQKITIGVLPPKFKGKL